jgi:Xaa-Pro aminopeptidase
MLLVDTHNVVYVSRFFYSHNDRPVGLLVAAMREELEDGFDGTKCGVMRTVNSGPRATLPHEKTMPQMPLAGETLIAGIGASVGGYHAESGAISSAGSMSIDQRCCLDAASASDAARKLALFPGASCTAANDAGLRPIREAGFDNFIRHRIGHGMGIQGHNAAWDARQRDRRRWIFRASLESIGSASMAIAPSP